MDGYTGNIWRFVRIVGLSFAIQFCGNGITFYLTILLDTIGIKSSKTQLIINGCLGVAGFFTAIECAIFIDDWSSETFGVCRQLDAGCVCNMDDSFAINQERNFHDIKLAKGFVDMIYIFSIAYHLLDPRYQPVCHGNQQVCVEKQGINVVSVFAAYTGWTVQHLCQPGSHGCNRMAVLYCLLLFAGTLRHSHALLYSRD